MSDNIRIAIFRTINSIILCLAVTAFLYAFGTIGYVITGLFNGLGVQKSWEITQTEYYAYGAISTISFILGFISLLAATPVGEILLKAFTSARDLSDREQEKIQPIINNLKKKYLERFGEPLKINVYMVDSNDLNGISMGYSTIGIHRIVLKSANEEEIAGMLSHEIGHLHHRDGTFSSLRFFIGNMFALATPFIGSNKPKNMAAAKDDGSGFFGAIIILGLFLVILTPIIPALICLVPLMTLFRWTSKWEDWPEEYRADAFAIEMGYRDGLISLLEKLADRDERTKTGFLAKLKYSHPPIETRIDRLQRSNI